MANKYAPELKYGRMFGHSDVFPGDGTRLSDMDMSTRVDAMAYFHACPVKEEVVAEFGEEWTFKRYLECNSVNKNELLDRAKVTNNKLFVKLTTPIQRLPGELPNPKINRQNVPKSFEKEMSPLSGPVLYAWPRMILHGARNGEEHGDKKRVAEIRSILAREIPKIKDPVELVLMTAERLIEMGTKPDKLVYHLMSKGILEEEGCKSIYRGILTRMEKESPKLFQQYEIATKDADVAEKSGIITRRLLE